MSIKCLDEEGLDMPNLISPLVCKAGLVGSSGRTTL
jgi:hypothetical protein